MRIMPALINGPVNRNHVVGEKLAKPGVGQNRLALSLLLERCRLSDFKSDVALSCHGDGQLKSVICSTDYSHERALIFVRCNDGGRDMDDDGLRVL